MLEQVRGQILLILIMILTLMFLKHTYYASRDVQKIKKKPNAQGIALLDLCKASSMSLMNGRFGKYAGIGEYTPITNNGCSVVDYFLGSSNCVDLLTGFCVCDPTVYSDHSLLYIACKASEQVN